MPIIITADDFGYSNDVVDATVKCFNQRALTSASIMVNMPASERAMAFAKVHPEFSFGVHLTFVSDGYERPLCKSQQLPHLVASNGQFMNSNIVRILALLRRLPVEEIAREMNAQLGKLHDFGVPISYVDSHGHLHKFAPFLRAMRLVLPRFGIRRVRGVQNFFLKPPRKSPTYWFSRIWGKQIQKDFLSTDYFYMPTSGGNRHWGSRVLQRLPLGTLEVGVHPGSDTEWQADETASVIQFAEEARRSGHALIGWRELS